MPPVETIVLIDKLYRSNRHNNLVLTDRDYRSNRHKNTALSLI